MYTAEEKAVSEYCGISMLDVEELDILQYYVYLRDARIYNLSQTEDGQEYLANAWRINQTAPERKKLREKYGKQSGDH